MKASSYKIIKKILFLTLVFFVNDIDVEKWPLERVRDKNSYDNFIERKIKNFQQGL